MCTLAAVTILLLTPEAHAIPAFASKYNVNCTVCHTAANLEHVWSAVFGEWESASRDGRRRDHG